MTTTPLIASALHVAVGAAACPAPASATVTDGHKIAVPTAVETASPHTANAKIEATIRNHGASAADG